MSKRIELQRVFLGYGDTTVIKDISLELEANRSYSIIGPSGCGKTTLLYGMAGIVKASSGSILVEGQLASSSRKKSSIILQDYGLFPWKSVWENVSLPLLLNKELDDTLLEYGELLLESLGISNKREVYPSELSGGQKQRVAIARAWITKPDVLLMDEPFSSLDAMTRESLQDTVVELAKEQAMTLVLVTHSIEEAVFMTSKIIVLNNSGEIHKIIENPKQKSLAYREHNAYYQTCLELRKTLKEL